MSSKKAPRAFSSFNSFVLLFVFLFIEAFPPCLCNFKGQKMSPCFKNMCSAEKSMQCYLQYNTINSKLML